MSGIQQLYCTHCTFGSSALESREGAMLDKPLGYSVRAGSGTKDELRRYFRDVERFLYYYLPSDAPAEQKLQLVAETAPKRLVFCPNINGQQMLGQLSYRQYDTAGRPGSYFGHILLSRLTRDNDQNRWSPLDALRSWHGRWTQEDDPGQDKKLIALESIDQVIPSGGAVLTDELLLAFLTTPAGQPFADPAGVIPQRWRDVPPAERADLLATALQAYVALGGNRRESVLLVIEHSLAALIFYGIARLLPAGPVLNDFGFSTFETNPDRLPVPLAALEFHDPTNSDLRPEVYRGRNFAANTWLGRRNEDKRFTGRYGKLLVDTLIHKGWLAVDELLADFARTNPTNTTQLEPLAAAAVIAEELLTPTGNEVKFDATNKSLHTFLSRRVCALLTAAPPSDQHLAALADSPKLVPLLNLIADENAPAEVTAIVEHLLSRTSRAVLPAIIAAPQISTRFKELAIVADICQHGWRLPDNCPTLWQLPPVTIARGANPAVVESRSLLSGVLARLELDQVEALFTHLPKEGFEPFAHALVSALPKQHDLGQLVERAALQLDEPAFLALVKSHARILKAAHSQQITARVETLLNRLSASPKDFTVRMAALKEGVVLCGDVAQAELKLASWEKLGNRVKLLRPTGKTPDKHRQAEIFGDLALMLYQLEDYDYGVNPSQRVRNLQSLCDGILGSPIELPPEVQRGVHKIFHTGTMLDYRPYGSRGMTHLAGVEKKTLMHFGIATGLGVGTILVWMMLTPASQKANSTDTKTAQAPHTKDQKGTAVTNPTNASNSKPGPTADKNQKPENQPTKSDLLSEAAERGRKKLKDALNFNGLQLSELKGVVEQIQNESVACGEYREAYFHRKKHVRSELAGWARKVTELSDRFKQEKDRLDQRVMDEMVRLCASPILSDQDVVTAMEEGKVKVKSPEALHAFLLEKMPELFATLSSSQVNVEPQIRTMRANILSVMIDLPKCEDSPPTPPIAEGQELVVHNYQEISEPGKQVTTRLFEWSNPPASVELKLHRARYDEEAKTDHISSWDQLEVLPTQLDTTDELAMLHFFEDATKPQGMDNPSEVISGDNGAAVSSGSRFPLRREVLRIRVKQEQGYSELAHIGIEGKELIFVWASNAVSVSPKQLGVLRDSVLQVSTSEGTCARFICLSDQRTITVEETHNGTLNHPVFTPDNRQFFERALNIRVSSGTIKAVRRAEDGTALLAQSYPLERSNAQGREGLLEAATLAKECDVEYVEVDEKNLGPGTTRNSTPEGTRVSIPIKFDSPNKALQIKNAIDAAKQNVGIEDGKLRAEKNKKAPPGFEKIKEEAVSIATLERDRAVEKQKSAKAEEDGLRLKIKEAKERVRGLNLTLCYEAGEKERPIKVEWCKIVSAPGRK